MASADVDQAAAAAATADRTEGKKDRGTEKENGERARRERRRNFRIDPTRNAVLM